MSTDNHEDLNEFREFLKRLTNRSGNEALRDAKKIQSAAEFALDSQNALMMTNILAKYDIFSVYLDHTRDDADQLAKQKLSEDMVLPEKLVKPYLNVVREVLGEETVTSEPEEKETEENGQLPDEYKSEKQQKENSETEESEEKLLENRIYLPPMPQYHDEAHMDEGERILREADNYSYGISVVQDYQRAGQLYQKAAELGNPRAQLIGLVCNSHAIENQTDRCPGFERDKIDYYKPFMINEMKWNDETKINQLKKLAQDGIPEAQYIYGYGCASPDYGYFCHYYNEDESKKWIQKAAENGYMPAMKEMARICEGNGYTYKKEPENAVKWWEKAAVKGSPDAEYYLGCAYFEGDIVPKDPVEGEKWLRRSAAQGDEYAQKELKEKGRKKEPVISLLDAPEVTPAIADKLINDKYEDNNTARKYYLKAAEAGYAEAQIKLADTYAYTSSKRIEWLTKAAEQGNWRACEELSYIYEEKESRKQSFNWMERGAEYGDPKQQYNLGKLISSNYLERDYDDEAGRRHDHDEALKWYRLSAKQGYKDAIEKLKSFN